MRFLLTLLVSISLVACSQSKKTTTNTDSAINSTSSELFLTITKTPCYGKCPAYIAKIYSNGDVEFNGKSFVDFIGEHKGSLNADQINSIKNKIIEINFFELNDKYDSNVTDFPSCILDVNIDGKEKSVLDRVGGPKELKELEKLVHDLVLNSSLTKLEK